MNNNISYSWQTCIFTCVCVCMCTCVGVCICTMYMCVCVRVFAYVHSERVLGATVLVTQGANESRAVLFDLLQREGRQSKHLSEGIPFQHPLSLPSASLLLTLLLLTPSSSSF